MKSRAIGGQVRALDRALGGDGSVQSGERGRWKRAGGRTAPSSAPTRQLGGFTALCGRREVCHAQDVAAALFTWPRIAPLFMRGLVGRLPAKLTQTYARCRRP